MGKTHSLLLANTVTLKTYHWLKSYMECSARTAAMPLEDAMAASSRDDIPRQLAALLGRESVCQIRKTDTVPPRISVIDVVEAITGQVKSNAGKKR